MSPVGAGEGAAVGPSGLLGRCSRRTRAKPTDLREIVRVAKAEMPPGCRSLWSGKAQARKRNVGRWSNGLLRLAPLRRL